MATRVFLTLDAQCSAFVTVKQIKEFVQAERVVTTPYLMSSRVFSTSAFCFSRVLSLAMVASLTFATLAASACMPLAAVKHRRNLKKKKRK